MKRYLFIFVLLVRTAYGQQPSGDTLCLPVGAVQNLVIARDQKKVLEEQVSILNTRIANYEKIIDYLNQKDSATIYGYSLEIQLMNDQRVVFEKQIADLNKYIRKDRFNRTMRDIGWGAALIIMSWLYITK